MNPAPSNGVEAPKGCEIVAEGGSADAQIVDALERGATGAADERVAIAAEQRIGDRLGTRRTVEFDGGLNRFGHSLIISV